MIHLALEVLAFLFLCWVGLIVLGIVVAILGAITDGLGKLSAPYRPPSSKIALLRWAMIQLSQAMTQERARYA